MRKETPPVEVRLLAAAGLPGPLRSSVALEACEELERLRRLLTIAAGSLDKIASWSEDMKTTDEPASAAIARAALTTMGMARS